MIFKVPFEIYPFDLIVSIGDTDDAVRKKLILLNLEEEDIESMMFNNSKDVGGRCLRAPNGLCVIRIRENVNDIRTYSKLQHEIFHCVAFFMEYIDMPLNLNSNDEAYAYLTQDITSKILHKISNGSSIIISKE